MNLLEFLDLPAPVPGYRDKKIVDMLAEYITVNGGTMSITTVNQTRSSLGKYGRIGLTGIEALNANLLFGMFDGIIKGSNATDPMIAAARIKIEHAGREGVEVYNQSQLIDIQNGLDKNQN